MNKKIFFLIDGLADKPYKNTPLRLAKKPNIAQLLPYSFLGKFFPLKKNEWPKTAHASVSQLANLGILGYDVKNIYAKRGPIEAIGSDIEYKNGWLALRFDFGTINEKMRVIDRRAGRNIFGLDEIINDLQKIELEIPFTIQRTYGHRGVIIFKAELSDKISNSDPLKLGKKILKIKPLAKDELSKKTFVFVQKFLDASFEVLKNHPANQQRIEKNILSANYLLTREAGNQLPELIGMPLNPLWRETSGAHIPALVIAENGVIKGTCKLAGFETLTIPEIEPIKQLDFIFNAIKQNYQQYNLIYVHLKGADEAGHDKNCEKKKNVIETFDRYFGNLVSEIGIENFTYIITGDHITDCKTGRHEFGAVPILYINKNIKSNNPQEFSEITAKTLLKNIWDL
ncbi:MAG: hypothetical protein AAB371_02065 [Patescibacteria group bacterium]